MRSTTLAMNNVGKVFRGPDGLIAVLRDIQLTLSSGEAVMFTGPPGSGKSTLLSIGASFLRPTTGEVYVGSVRVSDASEHRLATIRRLQIGFLFQDFQLIRGLTAAENIAVTLVPLGLSPTTARQRVLDALKSVHMDHRADYAVNYLSGGEQQRVAFARALIHNPALVFADEPTASVDQDTARVIMALLEAQKSRGATLVMASHDTAMIAAPFVDKWASLDSLGQLSWTHEPTMTTRVSQADKLLNRRSN